MCYPLEFESNQIVTVSYPKQCLPLFLWSIYITHHLQSIQLKERDDYFLIVLHRLIPKEEILTTSNVKRTILLIHWKIRQIHLATCFDCQPKCKNTIRFLSIIWSSCYKRFIYFHNQFQSNQKRFSEIGWCLLNLCKIVKRYVCIAVNNEMWTKGIQPIKKDDILRICTMYWIHVEKFVWLWMYFENAFE